MLTGTFLYGDRLLLGNFGNSLRKWGFTLDQLLSANRGNPRAGYTNESYLGTDKREQSGIKLIINNKSNNK